MYRGALSILGSVNRGVRQAKMPSRSGAPEALVHRAERSDLDACFAIRRTVFVVGQGVPLELDRDDDDAKATHWIARAGNGEAVGTARARVVGGSAKAERVAVLRERRGTGVGRSLMEAVEQWAASEGLGRVELNAQVDAVPFYLALGYREEGELFEEAGIPHRAMSKPV